MPPLPPDAKRAVEPRNRAAAEVSSEEFLFHLYRGSELLQDNRVHEAKEELEAALGLQPRDPKGQDLLAVVYFRLGMYPRAIEIFEQLVRAYPDERTPRVNLALCYVKTGQPQNARQLLEETVLLNPENARAWGYLGLAYERLGDYVKAREAFLRGNHEGMARRMDELIGERWAAEAAPTPVTEPFAELETELAVIDAASPASVRPASMRSPSAAPPPVSLGAFRAPSALPPPPRYSYPLSSSEAPMSFEEVPPMDAFVRSLTLVFPGGSTVAMHGSGYLRVSLQQPFSCRLSVVRALVGPESSMLQSEPVPRRARGKAQDDPLGGHGSPIVRLVGSGHAFVGPHPGRRLFPFQMNDEIVFLREDALVGFESAIVYENGRLAVGDGDAAAMVQLRGTGAVLIEAQDKLHALEVVAGDGLAVRREHVLGWIGRLVPRALNPSEAPASQRGLVLFSGEGVVILDPR